MTVIAIIPARGGSKGIPNKNIRLLNGKPLLAWSIEQARQSLKIQDVYVSSDCNNILQVAEDFGAKRILRPSCISGDNASSESAWLHAINEIEKVAVNPQLVVGIQATSPIRHSTDFDEAITKFYYEQLDSLFSSNLIEDFHVWEENSNSSLTAKYDYKNRKRRQNIVPKFLENGNFYLFTPQGIKESENRLHGRIGTFVQNKYAAPQIDEPIDLKICSALMSEFICE